MIDRYIYSRADEALRVIKSGQRVFIHGSAATPTYMLQKLAERAPELRNVELVCISVLGDFSSQSGIREQFLYKFIICLRTHPTGRSRWPG